MPTSKYLNVFTSDNVAILCPTCHCVSRYSYDSKNTYILFCYSKFHLDRLIKIQNLYFGRIFNSVKCIQIAAILDFCRHIFMFSNFKTCKFGYHIRNQRPSKPPCIASLVCILFLLLFLSLNKLIRHRLPIAAIQCGIL